jgi:hypothetical protein
MKALEPLLGGTIIAQSTPNQRMPLVEGIAPSRLGSMPEAWSKARAKDLKMDSAT